MDGIFSKYSLHIKTVLEGGFSELINVEALKSHVGGKFFTKRILFVACMSSV